MRRSGEVGCVVSKKAQIADAGGKRPDEAKLKQFLVKKTERAVEHKQRMEQKERRRAEIEDDMKLWFHQSAGMRHRVVLRASIFVLGRKTTKWKHRSSNWKENNVFNHIDGSRRHKFPDWHLSVKMTGEERDREAIMSRDKIWAWVQSTADLMDGLRQDDDSWNHKEAIWSSKFVINEGDLPRKIKIHWVTRSIF
ncbi:MAG: hypothetical protein Harvfovirus37_15 [Harvfovirus sp.]|uniref:Uncharacterized protein n=1 Tax=Harvfovirus sp. TaxID=2487768 RepID=A0A3G5A5I7_9VIRU|nr:MAG: hypothetical protein Harvfovirus37_15 [Harvfovirus sp.]